VVVRRCVLGKDT